MKRHTLVGAGFWPWFFTILIFLLFVLATIMFKWRSIEEDVASNAKNDLSSQGFEWATTDTFNLGRTVEIKGIAPSQTEADKALELAKKSKGVHRVRFHHDEISIAPKTPPYLNAIVTQDSIVLRGTVKDQAAVDKLLMQANAAFGKDNVLNKLSIGENTDDFANYDGLFQAMRGKGSSAPFSASFVEDTLTLNGETIGVQNKIDIGKTMSKLTGLAVNNNLNVILPEPVVIVETPPVVETIKEDVCLNLVNEILSNGKINFQTGKASISQDSFELLESLGETAKRCPDSRFIIAGHTDSTGNLNSNIKLSKLRAQSVVDHLVGLGLNSSQFSAAGFGPSQPIADNSTADGRSKNRRIEFKLYTEQNNTDLGEAE